MDCPDIGCSSTDGTGLNGPDIPCPDINCPNMDCLGIDCPTWIFPIWMYLNTYHIMVVQSDRIFLNTRNNSVVIRCLTRIYKGITLCLKKQVLE
jgi:hypothetical protein